MTRRSHRHLFWIAAAVMVVAHMDPFASGEVEPVVLGWIPRDLGYHLVWITLAAILTFYMCAMVWPDEE